MKAYFLSLSLMLWLLTFPASRCTGYEFTVEGEIRLKGYSHGQLEGETNYNFVVQIRDCSSRIRVFGAWFSGTEFKEYGWDTTNSYMFIKLRDDRVIKDVQRFEAGQFRTVTLDKPVKSQNDATLTLYPHNLPEYGRRMEPVWLAYASPCHYQARKSGTRIKPVWYMGGGVLEANILFTSEWRMNKDAPHLLEFMVDFTDGNKYEVTGRKPLAVRMPKPFDVETTNSMYQVLSWTNVAGMVLADRFQVTRYVPDTQGSTPSLLKLEVYEGIAHSIRPTCATTDFSPNVSSGIPTQITDHRLEHDNIPASAIGYFSPDGKVQDLEELRVREGYKRLIWATDPRSGTNSCVPR